MSMPSPETSRGPNVGPRNAPTTSEVPAWNPAQVSNIMRQSVSQESSYNSGKAQTLQGLIDSLNGFFPPSSQNALGGGNSDIVAAAKTFKGTDYVWGGQSKDGIDCSGLVIESMKKTGVNVPDMTAADMKAKTPEISAQAAQPGDLAIADSGKHVEIVTGVQGGQIATIGSASSRGGVSEGTLSLGSYKVHKNTLGGQGGGNVPPQNIA